MITIINRNPTGRLISLHSLVKYLHDQFGENTAFGLRDMKYDSSRSSTILDFFPLAKIHPITGNLYDPYLENPFSKAGSHLTQGVDFDSQKSKSVSDCANALHGLGLIAPAEKKFKLTAMGIALAKVDYKSSEFLEIIRESLLSYGPFVGFLFQCMEFSENNFVERDKISISYPTFQECVKTDGRSIILSAGSQRDTVTRTRSVFFAWAITAGYVIPAEELEKYSKSSPHTSTLDLIAQKDWSWRKFKVYIPQNLFIGDHVVNNPLEYNSMTKSTKALRERGQKEIRELTMKYEPIIKNRRFAIICALAHSSWYGEEVSLETLYSEMEKFPEVFVINGDNFREVMNKELDIAIAAGIPFRKNGKELMPLVKVNPESLLSQLPTEVAKIFNTIICK